MRLAINSYKVKEYGSNPYTTDTALPSYLIVIVRKIEVNVLNESSFLIYKIFSIDIGTGLLTFSTLNLLSCLGKNSSIGIVHIVELGVIDVGSLDDLDLSDLNVLDGVNRRDILGDLLLNNLAGEQVEDLSDVGFGNFLGNDVVNSLADNLLLGRKGIVGLALLVEGLFGEANHKHSKDISVAGLNIRDSLNESLSLLDQGADFVLGGVNTVEAGDGLSTFSLVDDQLDFSPVEAVLVGSKISLHLRDDSSFDAIFDLF